MSKNNRKIHLELTIEQAQALIDAADLYARLGIGQFEEFTSLMRFEVIKMADYNGKTSTPVPRNVLDEVEQHVSAIKALIGHPRNGSYGIGHPSLHATVGRNYEIKKVLEQAVAYERDPNPDFKGVNYDGLIVRYTSDPAPVAKAVDG